MACTVPVNLTTDISVWDVKNLHSISYYALLHIDQKWKYELFKKFVYGQCLINFRTTLVHQSALLLVPRWKLISPLVFTFQKEAGWLGFYAVLAGCAGSVALGRYARKVQKLLIKVFFFIFGRLSINTTRVRKNWALYLWSRTHNICKRTWTTCNNANKISKLIWFTNNCIWASTFLTQILHE